MPIYGQENPLSDRTKPIKGFFFLFEILFSYSETLSENGSHELTGALHILGPTLEAMNWWHCIPRVGVHYIWVPCFPTVADWSLSTVPKWSAWSRHLSLRCHTLPVLHVIWIVSLSSFLHSHRVDINNFFQIPRCSLGLSMFPWRAARVTLRRKRLAADCAAGEAQNQAGR